MVSLFFIIVLIIITSLLFPGTQSDWSISTKQILPNMTNLSSQIHSKTYKCTEDTTSRDSDSLIHEYVEATESVYCWNHPKVRENWKTVCAAVILLVVGIGLIGMGAFAVAEPKNGLQGAVFFVAGLICFVPGAYHVVYIWLAARGQRGYDFYHLPLFTWFVLWNDFKL